MLIAPVAVIGGREPRAPEGHRRDDRAQYGPVHGARLRRRRAGDHALRFGGRQRGHHLCGEHRRHGGDQVYSTLVFVAAALIAMLLGFSPKFGALIHHSRAGDRRRLDRGIWLNCRRRGADLGAKPGGSESKQQFDHGVGDRCWAPAISRCRWAALRWAGLARPPSGRSCCTRCFIAGRARRRRRGNAGVSHISAALAQGAVWAGGVIL